MAVDALTRSGEIPPSTRTAASFLLPGGVGLLAAALFWLVHDALIDDSYIALGYARNLAFHGHWGLIAEEPANTATAPLNVLLLAAGTALLRSPVAALGVLFVLSAVVLALSLRRAALETGLPGWTGALGAGLVLLNPLVLSSAGLEVAPAAALLGVLLLSAVRPRPVLFGLATGALALLRLDLLLFAVVVLLGRPALWRGWTRWLPIAALALPWFLWSWLHFGSAVPDTLLIKQLQESWGGWTVRDGIALYVDFFPAAVLLSAVPAYTGAGFAVFLVLLRIRGRVPELWPWTLLGVGAVLHHYAYTLLGVPPYHWYYAPAVVGLCVLLAGGIGAMAPHRFAVVPVLVAAVGVLAVSAAFAVQHGMPWRSAAITTNWAAPAEYARIGTELGRVVGDRTVSSPGEIGTLAYFCGCRIVDQFSDRGYLDERLRQRLDRAGSLERALLAWNHRHFEPTEPRPVDLVLRRVPGPGPDPRWTVRSPWSGTAHFVLESR
ncbi:hypothetical protein [Saccharopolyspora cebuensis]|uniref:4-amino-4-deoxy-L-arabinose transferase n=1 Tax=Saccharopolyspora cebuensis TaxID=418759 RepID=A0ABV4CFF1_9PSEU